jgi:hypothetical protein
METLAKIAAAILVLLLIACLVASCIPSGRAALNTWQHELQKVDDATRYETRKQVEDTCRATIVSYEADRLTWLQYKDSESAEQRSWADAAKIRANKAALTYNEYFLKNSYVFEGNIPEDIREELPLLE